VQVVAWYVEQGSGGLSLDRRPILLEALAAVAAHGAGLLVVQKLCRFSREPLTAALGEAELQRHGATLAVADGAGSGDDPTASLIRSILFAVGRFEKEMIRARIRAALQVKRSRGERIGAPPFGFKVEGKNLVPHPEEAATKERLRAMRASGMTLQRIRSEATAQGLRNRFGRPFNLASIHALVRPDSASPAE
jgi:DNA invertase Pin-like site-specific DNA recombinase